jgi:hypothetical protein
MRLEFSTSRIGKFLGRIEESPSLQLVSKVSFIADTKENLGLPISPLLNDWGCYCESEPVDATLSNRTYASGIEKTPYLVFTVFPHFLSRLFLVRFGGRIHPNMTEEMDEIWKSNQKSLTNSKIEVLKYKPGSWEKGLEISFKATMWLQTNVEEALANIWKIPGSLREKPNKDDEQKVNTPEGIAHEIKLALGPTFKPGTRIGTSEATSWVRKDGAVCFCGESIVIKIADDGVLDIKIRLFSMPSWVEGVVVRRLQEIAKKGGKITYYTESGIVEVKTL